MYTDVHCFCASVSSGVPNLESDGPCAGSVDGAGSEIGSKGPALRSATRRTVRLLARRRLLRLDLQQRGVRLRRGRLRGHRLVDPANDYCAPGCPPTGPVTASATRPATSRSAASTTATATSPRPQRRGRATAPRCDWGARVHLPRHLPVRSLVRQRWHVRRQWPRLGVRVMRLRRLFPIAGVPGAAVAAGAAAAAVAAAVRPGRRCRRRGTRSTSWRAQGLCRPRRADRPRDARAGDTPPVCVSNSKKQQKCLTREGEEQVLLRQEMQQGGECFLDSSAPGARRTARDRADVDVVHEMRVGNGGNAPTSICCERVGSERHRSLREIIPWGVHINSSARHSATGSGALQGARRNLHASARLNSQRADK